MPHFVLILYLLIRLTTKDLIKVYGFYKRKLKFMILSFAEFKGDFKFTKKEL